MSGTPRLCAYVHVDGRVWEPGDEPPPEVAARIPNPKAWADGVLPAAAPDPDLIPGGDDGDSAGHDPDGPTGRPGRRARRPASA
jgi:hypothetical protein